MALSDDKVASGSKASNAAQASSSAVSGQGTSVRNAASFYPQWRPTLRPRTVKSTQAHSLEESVDASRNRDAAPIGAPVGAAALPKDASVETSGDGGSGNQHRDRPWHRPKQGNITEYREAHAFDLGSQVEFPQLLKPGARAETCAPGDLDLDAGICASSACVEALLGWLNNDDDDQRIYDPLMQEPLAALISAAETVNLTRCSKDKLSSMRSPWGDQACHVHVVAVWSVDRRAFSWKSENWLVEQRSHGSQAQNLLIASTVLPSGEGHVGDDKYLLVCRVPRVHGPDTMTDKDFGNCIPQEQFYVISCPPSVLPLRFATIVPTRGQLRWKLDHRQVLPLPEQN